MLRGMSRPRLAARRFAASRGGMQLLGAGAAFLGLSYGTLEDRAKGGSASEVNDLGQRAEMQGNVGIGLMVGAGVVAVASTVLWILDGGRAPGASGNETGSGGGLRRPAKGQNSMVILKETR